jgi:hypothetical protein
MIGRIGVAIGTAFSCVAFAQNASAQQVDCAAWAQQIQGRADAFDVQCARTPMPINGPQWQTCQSEQAAILAERDKWMASCRRH